MSILDAVRCKQTSLKKCLYSGFFCFGSIAFNAVSAPGAHGPNGEHLETESRQSATSNPKFESFTETFEVVGELLDSELVMFVHDYQTNIPISQASIELETGSVSAIAEYDEKEGHYHVSSESYLNTISQPGEHEVILTILTEDAADLLAATLAVTAQEEHHEGHSHEEDHHDEHFHIPWGAMFTGLVALVVGFFFGKKHQKGAEV